MSPEEVIREPTVIRGAKLYFEHIRRPAMHPALGAGYEATVKLSEDIYEWFVNETMFDFRVMQIVGYNPQKLLPAPTFEREFMQSVSEWAAEQSKLPYTEFAQSVFNTLTRDGEVTFSPTGRHRDSDIQFKLYPYQEKAMRALTGIDVERWNEADADPLADLQRWIDMVRDSGPIDPIVVVGAGSDFADVEAKVLRYMHATFVHESAGGSPTPRGRIEIFDYEGGTVIDLEGSGELSGRRDLVDDLFSGHFARQLGKTASMTAMMHKLERRPAPQKSYLDHDPTKRHKRRKQRGNPHKR